MISYENVVTELMAANPDFRPGFREVYFDLPFDVAGAFANFVVDRIAGGAPPEDPVIQKAFAFLNELGKSDDERIQDLLATGILEVLADSTAAREIAMKLLDPAVRDRLTAVVQGWWG